MAATEAFVNVQIPERLAAGQQVGFITPDGQQMTVKVGGAVAPGEMIRIAYQPSSVTGIETVAGLVAETQQPLPAVPVALSLDANEQATMMRQALLPTVTVSAKEKDRKASEKSWFLYVISMFCCCLCPAVACFLSPLMWLGVVCAHYSKTPAERILFPRQSHPAFISLATCIVATTCVCAYFSAAVGFGFGFGFVGAGPINQVFQDFKALQNSCVSIKAFGDAACGGHHFRLCHRLPMPNERSGICQEVAAQGGACADAVKQRGAKHSFDPLCSKDSEKFWEWLEQMQDEREGGHHHDHHHKEDEKTFMMWSHSPSNGHWRHHRYNGSEGAGIENSPTFPVGFDVQV